MELKRVEVVAGEDPRVMIDIETNRVQYFVYRESSHWHKRLLFKQFIWFGSIARVSLWGHGVFYFFI